MKRMWMAGVMLAICLSIAAYGTTAYFTAACTAENTITAGNIQIELHDSLPTNEEIQIMPGTKTDQRIQIENTGSHPAYIRIRIDKSIHLADNKDRTPDPNLIELNINTSYWTEQNGYYYYNSPLASGMVTEPLYTQICFSSEMDNAYQNSTASIRIHAAAVQSENNSSASGWPVE